MKDKISIIVPIYNVENYLDECLQSLINQTYNNLEIILVNDGSTDRSLEICKNYVSEYTNIYLYSKENGGLSDARNYGLDRATGKYVCFVDSDDYVSLDMVEYLYENLIKYDAPLVCCNINMVYDDHIELKHSTYKEAIIFNSEEAIRDTLYNISIDYASWNKLYKIELFEDKLRFPKGKIYEDMFIMHEIIHKAKKIVYLPESKYYYRQRSNSITKSKFSEKNFDLLQAYAVILKFVDQNYPNLSNDVKNKIVLQKLNLIRDICLSNQSKKYKSKIKNIRNTLSFSEVYKLKNNRFNYFALRYIPTFILQVLYNQKNK